MRSFIKVLNKFYKFVKKKNTIKIPKILFFNKTNKKCAENKGEVFRKIAGMTSLTLNSKLCKFLTLLSLTKMLQNFVQDSFFLKLTKTCHKDRDEVLASGPLQTIIQILHNSIFQ